MKAALPRPMILMALSSLGVAIALMALSPGLASANLNKQAAGAKKAAKAACKKSKTKTAKGKKNCRQAKKRANKLNRQLAQAKRNRFFDVCAQGCPSRTVEEGAKKAGAFQKRTGIKATVRVKPGTYVGGAFLDGRDPRYNYNGLTIMGVKSNMTPASTRADAENVVLDGAKSASNAIEARSVLGIKMLNMYAKNYTANTFFVWAAINPFERCANYLMKNLVSSDTRAYGLFARNCYGGKMVDSVGWNHGDSAFYVGETPCDRADWSSRSYDEGRQFTNRADESRFLGHPVGQEPPPCQRKPNWTILENIESFQNVLGYSGTNAKYVHIKDSVIYNNGAGLVPNTLDSERFEPGGWSKFTNNDIFWNNYNYYREDSEFQTISNGLGEIAPGIPVNFPIGIGVMLFGNDGIEVSGNRIFGHEKWGVASFSSPVVPGVAVSNSGDDAKNLNNTFRNNVMGGNSDSNAIDFLDDATGGGNCYQGNTAAGGGALTYELGLNNPTQPGRQDTVYPACPRTKEALNSGSAPSLQFTFGIQLELGEMSSGRPGSPQTVLGYAGSIPAASMECSWNGRALQYDPESPETFTSSLSNRSYTEKRPSDPTKAPACN